MDIDTMNNSDFLTDALKDAEELVSSEVQGVAREAKLYSMALKKLFEVQTSLGNAILKGLWHVYKNGLVMYLGDDGTEYNPEDFAQWALDTYGEITHNRDYLNALVNTVLRVFQPVHTAEQQGKPYTVPSNKKRVSVDDLLTDGKVNKLTTAQAAFANADEKDKEELLDQVLHGKRSDVEKVRDRINGKHIIFVPYFWEIDLRTGLYNIRMDGLDNDQFHTFKGLLGKSGKELMDRKE